MTRNIDTRITTADAQYTNDFINRFWQKVDWTLDPDECWKWQGAKNSDGYGYISWGHGDIAILRAHRVSKYLEVANDISNDKVLHTCKDSEDCVNPNHLYLGTGKDNQIDKVCDGNQHNQKLSKREVKKIYRQAHVGIDYGRIARNYPICRATVSDIKRGHSWSHVTDEVEV